MALAKVLGGVSLLLCVVALGLGATIAVIEEWVVASIAGVDDCTVGKLGLFTSTYDPACTAGQPYELPGEKSESGTTQFWPLFPTQTNVNGLGESFGLTEEAFAELSCEEYWTAFSAGVQGTVAAIDLGLDGLKTTIDEIRGGINGLFLGGGDALLVELAVNLTVPRITGACALTGYNFPGEGAPFTCYQILASQTNNTDAQQAKTLFELLGVTTAADLDTLKTTLEVAFTSGTFDVRIPADLSGTYGFCLYLGAVGLSSCTNFFEFIASAPALIEGTGATLDEATSASLTTAVGIFAACQSPFPQNAKEDCRKLAVGENPLIFAEEDSRGLPANIYDTRTYFFCSVVAAQSGAPATPCNWFTLLTQYAPSFSPELAQSISVFERCSESIFPNGTSVDTCLASFESILLGAIFDPNTDTQAAIDECKDDEKDAEAIELAQILVPAGLGLFAGGVISAGVSLAISNGAAAIIGGILSLGGSGMLAGGLLAVRSAPVYASVGGETADGGVQYSNGVGLLLGIVSILAGGLAGLLSITAGILMMRAGSEGVLAAKN